MHHISRNVSVCQHQVNYCANTFDALLRNNQYRFLQRCASASSSNFFIRSLQMSDAFYKASFFLNYITLLYDGDQLEIVVGAFTAVYPCMPVLLNLFDVAAHFLPRFRFWAHFTKHLFQNSSLGVFIATRRDYCVISEHFAAHLKELRGPPVGCGPLVEKRWCMRFINIVYA